MSAEFFHSLLLVAMAIVVVIAVVVGSVSGLFRITVYVLNNVLAKWLSFLSCCTSHSSLKFVLFRNASTQGIKLFIKVMLLLQIVVGCFVCCQ